MGGWVGAVAFFAASLVPSLLPRPWFVQAVVTGIGIALGYGVGSGVEAAIRPRVDRGDLSRMPIGLRIALAVAGMSLLVGAVVLHWLWQVDVRRLMGMEGRVWLYVVGSVIGGLVAGFLFMVSGRIFRRSVGAYVRLLRRWMNKAAALSLAMATLAVGAVLVLDVVIADRLFVALDRAYLASSERFDSDVNPPDSPFRSGGPDSLIPWETLGRQGRAFVSQGPDRRDLEAFHGEPGLTPIRVYAGLETAATSRERAEWAVADLERAGAFQREVLVLVAPTGTGWVDPYAVDPLEYMYNGDTAAVAVQYSYRPSWLVMIGNQDLAIEASRELFEAVERRLVETPPSNRPLVLLYGESLGSFGLEAAFKDLDDVRERTDGVLWVGPPRANRIWSRLVADRQPGSALWRPVHGSGDAVRFGPDGEALTMVDGPWLSPRVVYLQHASDPITWLSLDLMLRRPEWLDEPRGPDVSELMPYVPVVTFWQVVVDLIMGTNAPLGHGHKFGAAQAEAWSLIVPPLDWTGADTHELLAVVESSSSSRPDG